jgi:hypothetical protein
MRKLLEITGCHQCNHYSNRSGVHSCHMSNCAGDLVNYPKIPKSCLLPDAPGNAQQQLQPDKAKEIGK